jgi:hypothetical protein
LRSAATQAQRHSGRAVPLPRQAWKMLIAARRSARSRSGAAPILIVLAVSA